MLGELIADLQSLGVRVNEKLLQRRGGAGPADAGSLLIGGIPVNVPLSAPYVSSSPYSLERDHGRLTLRKNGNLEKWPVAFVRDPRFYGLSTLDGIPHPKIALLHGTDCLATSVLQRCVYWNSRRRCRFCGIELTLKEGVTLPRKSPRQLAEVSLAARDLDGVKHVVMTTGTGDPPGAEISSLAAAAGAVKDVSGLPVHAQFQPPPDLEALSQLKEGGVDTVGIHIECFDLEVLSKVAPAKAEGYGRYMETWKKAVDLFGPNQVSSFLIVGLGEPPSSILSGSKILADLGVYPFVTPLRPIPGSMMSRARPPAPDIMKRIYEKVSVILSERGLAASRSLAGCVRCGACSALPAFEEGVARIVCHPVRTRFELEQAMETRKAVFVEEQEIFRGSDQDENDLKSTHLVAETPDGIVGTVRVYPSGNGSGQWVGGRLAVKKGYRSGGAGEVLVREAVRHVKEHGCRRFIAHIQKENVPFFCRLGWKAVGPPEIYCGRLHQKMEADLGEGEE